MLRRIAVIRDPDDPAPDAYGAVGPKTRFFGPIPAEMGGNWRKARATDRVSAAAKPLQTSKLRASEPGSHPAGRRFEASSIKVAANRLETSSREPARSSQEAALLSTGSGGPDRPRFGCAAFLGDGRDCSLRLSIASSSFEDQVSLETLRWRSSRMGC
jgi:hypothetical protein